MRSDGTLLVSESGVSGTEDVKVLAESGADALLIGTVLMEAERPSELVSDYKRIYNQSKK